jgi:hypothetical protein
MDLQNLLRALEEFIYEIALWPIMLPRTLWRFGFRPGRIDSYVRAELDKPIDGRYSEYLSPILFWLLVGFAPTFISAGLYAGSAHDPVLDLILKEPLEVRVAALITFLISPPLAFAVGILVQSKTPITRESLRYPFYTQCMFLAPFYGIALAIGLAWFLMASPIHNPNHNANSGAANAIRFLGSAIAIGGAIGEAHLIRKHAPVSWMRTIGALVVTYFTGLLLMGFLELLAGFLLVVFMDHGK